MRLIAPVTLFTVVVLAVGLALAPPPEPLPSPYSQIISLTRGGEDRANAVAFSPDGSLLAVGSTLGIYLYDSQTLQQLRFTPTQAWVRSLAFSPDGSLLASGSYDSVVRLWRVDDGNLARELNGHSAWVRSVAFSPDGSLLASASDDDTVLLWAIPDGPQVLELRENTQGVRAVAFSPDGASLATGGFDSVVRLWRVADGSLLRELPGHRAWVRSLAFSPDGALLASGGFDANILLWRLEDEDGALLDTLEEHSSSVLGLSFSPDGSLLASASVDQTVRLWRMPEGDPYDLLSGHTDFVYSVDFSPDGASLASGAVDNTVRVWEIAEEEQAEALDLVSSPSNCIACHHPLGREAPPRVPEVSCTICHQDGPLVLNWCPIFPRSLGATTMQVAYDPQKNQIGVPQATASFGVVIASPSNGEHVYSAPGIMTFLPIDGYVFSADFPETEVELQVEVWSGSERTSSISAYPNSGGGFTIATNVRPTGGEPMEDLEVQHHCIGCHDEVGIGIPSGEIRLVVVATAPDGTQARDERWVYIDYSETALLPVQVLDEDGQALENIPVYADARLYEWRGRTFIAPSDPGGRANLNVEVLSQIPTTYEISIPPSVVGGVWYEGLETAEVELLPGQSTAAAVTLQVSQQLGEISGRVQGLEESLELWAIHLPDGEAQRFWATADGEFSLSGLMIGEYLLASDVGSLAFRDSVLEAEQVDLSQAPITSLELVLEPLEGAQIHGRITDADGTPLPFGWVSARATNGAAVSHSGAYGLYGLPTENVTVLVSAPGYYSQARVLDTSSEAAASLDFSLVLRPETRLIPWGGGSVLLPPETAAELDGQTIAFEQGWLWGSTQAAAEPLRITWQGMQISISSGRFVLASLPASPAWLYLMSGQAQIQQAGATEAVQLMAGEMVYLQPGQEALPVPYDQVVVEALSVGGDVPIQRIWQPDLASRLRDGLARIGIDAAQILAFSTYSVAVIALLVTPLVVALWALRNRRRKR